MVLVDVISFKIRSNDLQSLNLDAKSDREDENFSQIKLLLDLLHLLVTINLFNFLRAGFNKNSEK